MSLIMCVNLRREIQMIRKSPGCIWSFTGLIKQSVKKLAGAVNIADKASGSMLISAEQLIKTDPDIILFVKGFETFESISDRSGMAKLSAIRNQKTYAIDRYRLVAGAGLPEAVEKLRTLLNFNSNPER